MQPYQVIFNNKRLANVEEEIIQRRRREDIAGWRGGNKNSYLLMGENFGKEAPLLSTARRVWLEKTGSGLAYIFLLGLLLGICILYLRNNNALDNLISILYIPLVVILLAASSWGINLWILGIFNIKLPNSLDYDAERLGNSVLKYLCPLWLMVLSSVIWIIIFYDREDFMSWLRPVRLIYFGCIMFVIIAASIAFSGKKAFFGKIYLEFIILMKYVICAPFFNPSFKQILLGDMLTSLAKPLGDLCIAIYCLVAKFNWDRPTSLAPISVIEKLPTELPTGSMPLVIISYPSVIRMLQCLRLFFKSPPDQDQFDMKHLINTGKYLMGIVVIWTTYMFNSQHRSDRFYNLHDIIWIVACSIQTIYAYIWDLKQDWGLLADPCDNNDGNTNIYTPYGLRNIKELKLGPPGVYYMAMFINLVFRCTWLFRFIAVAMDIDTTNTAWIFGLQAIEVIRRFIWMFFRIEWKEIESRGFPKSPK